jgi:hypothetical protein
MKSSQKAEAIFTMEVKRTRVALFKVAGNAPKIGTASSAPA